MKVLTINIPEKTYNLLKLLVKLGYYTSMSEAIRKALRDFLEYEFRTMDGLKTLSSFLRKYNDEVIEKINSMAMKMKITNKVPRLENKNPNINVDILENEEVITQIINGKRHRTRVREYFRGDIEYMKNEKTEEQITPKAKPIKEYYINES